MKLKLIKEKEKQLINKKKIIDKKILSISLCTLLTFMITNYSSYDIEFSDSNIKDKDYYLKMLNTNQTIVSLKKNYPSSNVIDCMTIENYKMNIYTDFEISDELREKIETLIDDYPNRNGFYVETVDGNLKFGYNEDVVIFGASSVKAPYALYCYKELDKGNGSLDEMMVYEGRFTRGGTGNMQFNAVVGEEYSLKYLLYESIYSSDNIAYIMLQERFGKNGYNEMLNNLNCHNSKLNNGRQWIDTTPKELTTIWKEIYNYVGQDYDHPFYYSLDVARTNVLDECVNVNTIHKGGWTDDAYNESGIVYGNNPYIITVMTNSGGNSTDQKYVRDVIKVCDEIVKEYSLSKNKTYSLHN